MNSINIVGFGNQAKSWCENLRDSCHKFTLILRSGASTTLAQSKGFTVFDLVSHRFDQAPIALLVPDQQHTEIIALIKKNNPEPKVFLLAHGHSYAYGKLKEKFPHDQFLLFSLKSIGKEVRAQYLAGDNIGSVYSLEDFTSQTEKISWLKYIKQLALALGAKQDPIQVSMKEETDADLLSEQTLLCGFYPYMIEKVFQQMLQKNISPELAYYECFEESFLILKALRDLGPEKFFEMISPNALIGSYDAFENLPHQELDQFIQQQWQKIQDGRFQAIIDRKESLKEMKDKTLEYWNNSSMTKTFNSIRGQHNEKA
jgi:ketol-acid reductoisomerase